MRLAGSDRALLNQVQTDAGKAQPAFPVVIDAAMFPGQADGITLQSTVRDSVSNHQQQSIDAGWIAQKPLSSCKIPDFWSRNSCSLQKLWS